MPNRVHDTSSSDVNYALRMKKTRRHRASRAAVLLALALSSCQSPPPSDRPLRRLRRQPAADQGRRRP